MKRWFAFLFLLSLCNGLYAYDIVSPIGGRSGAMGRVTTCAQDLWALQNNPAGLSRLDGFSFGLYYENRWMQKATAFKCAGIAVPTKFGSIGLGFNQFGYENYHENKFGLAYAKAFGPYIQIGLQLDYLLLNTGFDYGSQSAATFELGLQSHLTEKLTLGAYVFNPAHFKLNTFNDEPVPVVMRFGLAYRFTKTFVGECEIEKNTDYEGVSLRGGLEYEAVKHFYIRAGAQTNPGIFTFGVGYRISVVQIDVSAQMHQVLGQSLQIGMTFSFDKK
ncbi:MAG: hypothetical protein ACTTKO_01835 [Candidatus Limimorpha sp.]